MKKVLISPSVLAADMLRLGEEITRSENAGADMHHLDIMDGEYVPNISFGFDVIRSIKKISSIPLDVHMMISCPWKYISQLKSAGADIVTVHLDQTDREGTLKMLKDISSSGMKACISVKPKESAELILPFIEYVDMVLIMTVEPGFGGQSFMDDMVSKIFRVKEMISLSKKSIDIQVDGGINAVNAAKCAEAGANVFVAGSSLFRAENMEEAMRVMREEAGRVLC